MMAKKPTYEQLEHAVEALRASEEKYRILVSESPLGIALIGRDGEYEYVNPKFTHMFGYTLEDIPTGREWFAKAFPDPELRDQILSTWIADLKDSKTGETRSRTNSVVCKDGSEKIVRFRPVSLGSGDQFVTYEDISDRQRAEEALRESEERLRTFMDSVTDFFAVTDKDENFVYVNKSMADTLGYSEEEMTGMHISEVIDEESMTNFMPEVKDLVENGKLNIEATWVKKDGEKVQGELYVTAIYDAHGDYIGSRGVFRNITDRKRAEKALKGAYDDLEQRVRERTAELVNVNKQLEVEIQERKRAEQTAHDSEEKYRNLVERAAEGIVILQDGLVKYANPRLLELTGYSVEDTIGTPFAKYVHPDEVTEAAENFKAWIAGEEYSGSHERRLVHKDGSIIHTEVSIGLITYQDKPAVLASMRDITERKLAEEALKESVRRMQIAYDQSTVYAEELKGEIAERKRGETALRASEEKYRSLVESAEDSVYLVDIDSKYLFMNEKHLSRFGEPEDQVMGRPYSEFHSPEETKAFTEKVNEVFKTSNPVWHEYRSDRDGRHFLRTLSPVKKTDGKTTAVTIVSKDITEQKRLEAQLQQAQRMEAIGTLAGGIAHDFNNVLMAIQGHTSLMSSDIDTDHPHFEHLSGIEHTVQRGAGLARQLLGFARGGKYEVKSSDMNELIEESCKMFGRTKKEIEIHTKYQKDIWPAEVDRAQIEQVLLNLYVNAWQAMPHGGHLYVETTHAIVDENDAKPSGIEPGNYVKIVVTDTGVGMDKVTQQRIFDPFFTTKEMGRGTGLGLASAYGIIKNHGGIIRVYSEEGEGSTFNIYLPASEKEIEVGEGKPVEEVVKGTGTILLVDDENMVLGVGKEMLERIGYSVMLATNGMEAVQVYRKHKDEIDLIILDMIMPEMGGGETYDQIKEDSPKVKVLLASGYSINGEATEILKRGCNGFIQKPFNMKELSGRIREVLDNE
ncbi:MAG: PAS domain S-box protein [Deltaproteobacteria bacterium]|nr:PAS domain S-box protein [Deltaproteobacteria bacterium]